MKRIEIYKKITEHFGEEKQVIKYLEELAELQTACCKVRLGEIRTVDNQFLEELADVEIMVKQMELIQGINIELIEIVKPDVSDLIRACIHCSYNLISCLCQENSSLIYLKSIIHSFKVYHGLKNSIENIKQRKIDRVLRRIEKEKADG